MVNNYIPKKGEIAILSFDPQSGHEQKGRRPALVLSNQEFNLKTGMVLVCPITSRDNSFSFHIELPKKLSTKGYLMIEQIKSLDFNSRGIRFVEKTSDSLLYSISHIINAIIN